MVSETTETSITWTWNASEGAIGYAVQVSLDEMFDDTDEIGLTLETSFTATPLPPNTSVFLRVRAGTGTPEALAAAVATGSLEGLVLSDWTTHVTGMSAMPPPEPEPEPEPVDPVSVMFMVPDGEFPFEPDENDDEMTAMASVNNDITVMSNTTAVVVPYGWMEGASPVKLHEGENMPFSYVAWNAMQSMVVSPDGATFKIMRVTVGANQEMEPTGDVRYVTCGPFDCVDGMDAPDFDLSNSAACNAWEPEVELRVGYIDNTVAIAAETDDARVAVANDGVDVGWVYSSSEGMKVTHHFDGATDGRNYKVSSPDAGDSSTDSTLTMTDAEEEDESDGMTDVTTAVDAFEPALLVDYTDAADDGSESNCASGDTYAELRSSLHRPDGCFRIVAADRDNNSKTPDPNWLAAYTLELAPKDADVDWGSKVNWEEDPFEDFTCESRMFSAMESMEADVCELFEEEVAMALDAGWAGSKGTTVHFQNLSADLDDSPIADDDSNLGKIRIPVPSSAESTRFATLWFSNNDGGKNPPDTDMYVENTGLEFELVDDDNDPISDIGDFGKVDFMKPDPDNGGATLRGEDGTAENGDDDGVNKCTDDDGDGCDAKFSADIEVTLAAGTALGCDPVKEMVTITCEWDANGEMGRYRVEDHGIGADGTGFGGFDTAGATGDREAGYIGAFAKCTVK